MDSFKFVVFVLATICCYWRFSEAESHRRDEGEEQEWAVRVPGGEEVARAVAEENGYKLVRALRSDADTYIMRRSHAGRRRRSVAGGADGGGGAGGDGLRRDKRVEYAERQVALERNKRGENLYAENYMDESIARDKRVEYAERQVALERNKRGEDLYAEKYMDQSIARDKRVEYAAEQVALDRNKRGEGISESRAVMEQRAVARQIAARTGNPHDPLLKKEWYLGKNKSAHGVRECWRQNLTGKGVVVSILDDGLERDHPDISMNYDAEASTDLNDDDDDPYPRYEETNENKHGTRCGGVVAMVANNNFCGTGIAFDARLGGVRVLDGRVTDRTESEAFGFNPSHIDIYSVSWGPTDNGRLMAGPHTLALRGILRGIEQGRGGLGALYSWASGDGGGRGDACWADGYQQLTVTIGVSSASEKGLVPFYGERCASTLTTTYSSDHFYEPMVSSTDLHHKCTTSHSGTSASAPIAAGILALLLERNPGLTWRDVQHIVAFTSETAPLAGEGGWYKNAAGFCVHPGFGHGLMHAPSVVALGGHKDWFPVGKQHVCRVQADQRGDMPINFSSGKTVTLTFHTDGCKGQESAEVGSLEHVVVEYSIDYTRRGDLYSTLTSAQGTVTQLITPRRRDNSTDGLDKWQVMSTHQWGEKPQGEWRLVIGDKSGTHQHGSVRSVTLILYGTRDSPRYLRERGSKKCHASRSPK